MSEQRDRDLALIARAAVDAIGPALAAIAKRLAEVEGQARDFDARLARIPPPAPALPGRDGRDGRDGADASFREPIDYAEGRSYPYGTVARWRGGLWFAHRATDGAPHQERSGWMLIVAGIAGVTVSQSDDLRSFKLCVEPSLGAPLEHTFVVPTLIYRGVHHDGSCYAAGDVVTFQGSLWIARRNTDKRPGGETAGTDSWQLAVKKGNAGHNGQDGASAPAYRGFYDPRLTYPANVIVRTVAGLWLSTQVTRDPPPADAGAPSKDWTLYLPGAGH